MDYITAYARRVGSDVIHPQLRCGSGYETNPTSPLHSPIPPYPHHYTFPYHLTSPLHPPIPSHLTTTPSHTIPPHHYTLPYHPTSPLHPPIPPHFTTTPSHTTPPHHYTLPYHTTTTPSHTTPPHHYNHYTLPYHPTSPLHSFIPPHLTTTPSHTTPQNHYFIVHYFFRSCNYGNTVHVNACAASLKHLASILHVCVIAIPPLMGREIEASFCYGTHWSV